MSMPRMAPAFGGWQRKITLQRRIQSVCDGLVETKNVPFTFRGTIQPLSPKQVELKPEGQRQWEWLQIHCQSFNKLDGTDQIIYNGKIFKVMGVNDYNQNGYIEYHLVFDYQRSSRIDE